MRTVFCKALARRNNTNARKVDGHEGRGIESREERRDKAGIGKVGLNGRNTNSSVVGGLGINEGAQEVKSEAGGKEEHGCTEVKVVAERRLPPPVGMCCHVQLYKEKI